jgi:hypothetical protein
LNNRDEVLRRLRRIMLSSPSIFDMEHVGEAGRGVVVFPVKPSGEAV